MTNGDNANTPEPNDEIEVTENKLLRDLLAASEASNKDFKALLEINRKLKDATVSQDALFKPIEMLAMTAAKMSTLVLDGVLYLDKLSVSNSDIGLNLEKMGTDITDQLIEGNIKYGKIEDHLETEIALHRIGIKGVNIGLRDSIVLLDKQGKQGQDLIKLMAEFSAKGASQETLEKMAKGIADVSENTATQARASIRALEQLADVEGVLSVMGLDERIIKGLTDVTVGWAPQHAISMGKVFKELLASEDPATLDLYGMGGVADLLKSGAPMTEVMEALRLATERVPEEFANFIEPLKGFRTLGGAIATFGGDWVNGMISIKEGFRLAEKGQTWERGNADKMRSSQETYGVSLIYAADTMANVIMAASVPAMQGLRSDIQQLNTVLTNNLPDLAGALRFTAGAFVFGILDAATVAAHTIGWVTGAFGRPTGASLAERFNLDPDPDVQNPNADASLRREASRYEKTYGEDVMPDIQTRSDERSDLAVLIGSEVKKALLEVDRRGLSAAADMGQVG